MGAEVGFERIMDGVEIDMDMERMIQEAYDNGYLRGYKKGRNERVQGDDLIRRSDAIAEICKARTPDVASHQYAEQFINAVCRVPSADRPKPVDLTNVYQAAYDNGYAGGKGDRHKGEWLNFDGEQVPLGEGGCPTESAWCSECGTWLVSSDEYSVIGKFCPNCGARMKGADDDSDNV